LATVILSIDVEAISIVPFLMWKEGEANGS
jgi:hypothetical protein